MRTPRVGDEVGIPRHSALFQVAAVQRSPDVVDLEAMQESEWVIRDVPWERLTYVEKEWPDDPLRS